MIEHYVYDHANRVITLERKLKDSSLRQKLAQKVWPGDQANQIFSFNYTYNDAGMVTEMVYPDGQMHSFSYDSQLNRLQKIGQGPDSASQIDFINSLSYNKAGVVTEMSYANGTSQGWQFDNRKRIKEINIKKGVDPITQMKYTLNGVGDIVGINLNEFEYDGFDRLISARTQFPGTVDRFKLVIAHFGTYKNGSPLADGRVYNPDADLDKDGRINGEDHITASYDNDRDIYDFEDFEYDRNGNRTKLVQNGDEYHYTYGPRNRLETIKLKKEGSKLLQDFAKYEYDANGNTVKRTIYGESGTSVIEFEYDTLNRLVKTTKNGSEITEYFYDNAGNRLIKKTAGQTTLYLRHGQIAVAMDLEVYESDPSNKGLINRYILSGDLLAGRITTTVKNDNSKVIENFYYHLDHLNSTKCVTKQGGTVEVLYEYRAFGEQLKRLDKDGNDTTDKAKYSYGGKELDTATNLYYFNARYYDPTIGRFINVDPLNDGQNWYVYCSNNPLCFVDPTGLEDEDIAPESTEIERQTELNEDAQVIQGVVSDVVNDADVQPGYPDASGNTDTTWCNRALNRMLNNLGYETDNLLNQNPYSGSSDINWTSANSMTENAHDSWINGGIYLIHYGGNQENRERGVQRDANRGNIIIAVWKNPNNEESGHVAMVYPSTVKYNSKNGPTIGQAGKQNGIMSLQEGFRDKRAQVEFYQVIKYED